MDYGPAMEPRVTKTQYGAWLATTSRDTALRIGVVGATEIEARERFAASLTRWRELNEEAEPLSQNPAS
jgi:hypothetical protein